MCSIGEDDFGDEGGAHAMVADGDSADITNNSDVVGTCKKCNKEGTTLYKLSFREPECRNCFLVYVRHKFRASLGSSKILPRNAKVLLIFDGTAESMTLLDMLYDAQTQKTFKRLHCDAQVLYIDDWLLVKNYKKLPDDMELRPEYVQHMNDVCNILGKYKTFKSFILPIESDESVKPISIENVQTYLQKDFTSSRAFLRRIRSIRSLTSQQDFLKTHRSHVMKRATNELDANFIFLSDVSTMLAAQLIAAITLGRGGSAALDVGLVDDRLGDSVLIVRPLKDLNNHEIQLYMRAQELIPLQTESYGVAEGAEASLQNLTKSFIDNLQQNFSATVSTVYRTGDKLALKPSSVLENGMANMNLNNGDVTHTSEHNYAAASSSSPIATICTFCHSPLDYVNSNTLLAMEFSHIVSDAGATLDKCPQLDVLARERLYGENAMRLRRLCHACRNIEIDSGDSGLIPQ